MTTGTPSFTTISRVSINTASNCSTLRSFRSVSALCRQARQEGMQFECNHSGRPDVASDNRTAKTERDFTGFLQTRHSFGLLPFLPIPD